MGLLSIRHFLTSPAVLIALVILGFAFSNCTAQQEINDDFSNSNFDSRVAERGEWKFENNVASCESDPELYKKHKNHGPIIKWPSKEGFTDCALEFEIKPEQCQRVVFTFNGDGHIFRLLLLDPAKTTYKPKFDSCMIGWSTKSSKENKGNTMQPEGMPLLTDLGGKWVKIKAVVAGDLIKLSIGDYQTKLVHPSLARDKNLTMLSFAQGSMSVRNFKFRNLSANFETAVKDIQPIQRLPDDLARKTKSLNANYAVYAPDANHEGKLPLVIFLHGAGGNGDGGDIKKLQRGTARLIKQMKRVGQVPCYYVVPQCARGQKPERGIWRADDLNVLLGQLKITLPIDADRVYLTGTSMGGYGTWCWAAAHPENFAAVAPVCGGTGSGGPKDVTKDLNQWAKRLSRVPLWAFHGLDDKVVPFSRSKDLVDLIIKQGGKKVRLTGYPNVGHNAGKPTFSDPKFYEWLFQHKRKFDD
ncbi:MAG: alpha/beta fold hydrolase [Mariniblastus sp.]